MLGISSTPGSIMRPPRSQSMAACRPSGRVMVHSWSFSAGEVGAGSRSSRYSTNGPGTVNSGSWSVVEHSARRGRPFGPRSVHSADGAVAPAMPAVPMTRRAPVRPAAVAERVRIFTAEVLPVRVRRQRRTNSRAPADGFLALFSRIRGRVRRSGQPRSRRTRRRILPEADFGISSTNSTRRICL